MRQSEAPPGRVQIKGPEVPRIGIDHEQLPVSIDQEARHRIVW